MTQITKTFRNCQQNQKRFGIHQGGSRSGKTYAILQYIIYLCFLNRNSNAIITICRETLKALKGTAMRDFFEILNNLNLYERENHNKTDNEYRLFGNLIEFIGVDDEQKVRGRKRDFLYINEANEVRYDKFVQLNMRTTDRCIIDYNPSEVFWSDELRQNFPNDCDFYVTTYRDNPFLHKSIREQIENYQITSPNYLWQIYGLGNFAMREGLVFEQAELVTEMPENLKKRAFGLDFGFTNDPTALIECGLGDNEVYCNELIYERGLLVHSILDRFGQVGVSKNDFIFADSANPQMIAEIKRAGYNIKGVTKGAGSIEFGLSLLSDKKLNVIGQNTWKERNTYVWAKKGETRLNVGVASQLVGDHAIDAIRYWAMESLKTDSKLNRKHYTTSI